MLWEKVGTEPEETGKLQESNPGLILVRKDAKDG